MATGLAGAGLLRAYVTPIATSSRLRDRVSALPRPLSARLSKNLELRSVPGGVGEEQVVQVATLTELLQVGFHRAGSWPKATQAITHARSVRFDRHAARLLRGDDLAVIVNSNSGIETIRSAAALGVRSFLDYPVAHHGWAQTLLQEEALLHPELADTLQLAELPGAMSRRMEAEIEEADRIFVFTDFHRRTFVEAGVDESKLVVTPVGVDIDAFRPADRTNDDCFRVLFVGQLSQRKGLSYVLDGFTRASVPCAELVLLGPGVGSARVWEHRAGVRHIGPVPHSDLPAYYRTGDVFVLPSLAEGLPQTVLEAMASGLPVIVSENAVGSEVVTDGVNGFIVPLRDPEAIAERLAELHADAHRRLQMGEQARRRAEELSWDAYGQRIVAAVSDSIRESASQ
jgi:glycosyltransferase involved in cell wall biosynthesis